MKVIILGGTSFFGKDIAREFFEAGHAVTLFTRGIQKPKDLPPHHHIAGDRNNPKDLQKAAQADEWDIVVDNIGYEPESVKATFQAFKKAKRYVFDSTVSVYRYAKNKFAQPLTENAVDLKYIPAEEDLQDIHWKYAREKRDSERVIVEECPIPWTILRPPVVYGPNDTSNRGFWYLARLLDKEPIILANGGVNSFRLAYSKDVGKSFLKAALEPKAIGKTYFIAQKELITLKDFLDVSAEALGVKPKYVSIPSEICGEMGGPHAPMINLMVDTTQAERDFGFKPTPFVQFATETAKWFTEHWKGNREELLKTRSRELELIEEWNKIRETLHAYSTSEH